MARTENLCTRDLSRRCGRVATRLAGVGFRVGFIALSGIMLNTTAMAQPLRPETEPARAEAESARTAEPQSASAVQSWVETLNLEQLRLQNTPVNWLVLLGAIAAGVLLGKLFSIVLMRVGNRITQGARRFPGYILTYAAGPVNLLLQALGLRSGLVQIAMPGSLAGFCTDVIVLLIHISVFWYAFNLVGIIEKALRKLTGHIVTVPNARIVSDSVENIGVRPYIRRIMNVTIRCDTPLEKVREAMIPWDDSVFELR